jgi:dephospho-CoA kinase
VIIAGLTGGIASGKSTLSRFLSEAGARIIDADKIARAVVEPGSPAYHEILSFFGDAVLLPNGKIDRKRLGDIIFNDPDKKARLDAIVHPRVFDRTTQIITDIASRSPDAVVIMDIPLLFETGMEKGLAEVIVVYAPKGIQLQRLMKRDGIDEQAAMARIQSQMPIEEKCKRATIVIDNSSTLSASRRQALAIVNQLKQRSITPTE